jgi:hypothetical protein
MVKLSADKHTKLLKKAIKRFWTTRTSQATGITKSDQGNRVAVTGGKQMDGFLELLYKVALDSGVPADCIYLKGNILPGYFRPSKDWDFLIISPKKHLIAVVELKSQVGSFGNNFNNRTEEALGSAVDLWTAFREQGFPQKQPPWLGYLILLEKTNKSIRPVKIYEPFFKVRPEFHNTSYLDRYVQFCQKLMRERLYSSACLIWTNEQLEFGSPDEDISFDSFVSSFIGFIKGKSKEFSE